MNNDEEVNKFKITINESLPVVDYSSKKNSKRVFGVLSNKYDNSTSKVVSYGPLSTESKVNSEDRPLIINSLGEGAIWICNINNNIENGDYITSSLIQNWYETR